MNEISHADRRIRPGVVVALGVLLGLVATLLVAAPAAAQKPYEYRKQAVAATNQQRVAHDRPRVRSGPCVQTFARRQAVRMAKQQRMFHQRLSPVLARCGLSRVGENVARGYPTGWAVVNRGWMKSPPHRANLLHRRYRVIGVAARRGGNGAWYVSQVLGRH